jgi:NAD(P)-dependent dehydrogenase (short-subunit alcohol dehydrogenase family)
MIDYEWGHITRITSDTGRTGDPKNSAAYAASKAVTERATPA